MTMARTVAVELLDHLATDDPAAIRSRRDLRRVHHAMGTRRMLAHALKAMLPARQGPAPLRLIELGAGDGSLMLGVARALAPAWPRVELTLLDAQALIGRATIAAYAELGWTAVAHVGDVFDWARSGGCRLPDGQPVARWDLVVANLFLHHFEDAQLTGLLAAIGRRGDRFFACEPRRAWFALAASHLIGAIGANAVTREDAVSSVHAGFRARELTALWPAAGAAWQLREYPAGLFGHCFRAEPVGAG